MKHGIFLTLEVIMISLLSLAFSVISCDSQTPDWSGIEKVFGRKGTAQGDMYKITFPRSDMSVSVGDVRIEPGLALTSWVAFKPMGDHAMLMGDLVLLETEIAPAEKTLMKNHLEVSAIHNHVIGEQPRVMYMHVGGEGEVEKLAQALMTVLSQTGTPLGPPSLNPNSAANINWTNVESILGRTGKRNGNLLQFGIPRAEQIIENGMEIPPFMGTATAINLQRVGEKEAATTGDFVLLASEVNPVIKALNDHGITVTALHSHMLFESPRLFFMHFWAVHDPQEIAAGLKAALDSTNSAK